MDKPNLPTSAALVAARARLYDGLDPFDVWPYEDYERLRDFIFAACLTPDEARVAGWWLLRFLNVSPAALRKVEPAGLFGE